MEFYCMKDVMADIYFVFKRPVDEQTRIPAHKFVLSLASEVFHKELVYQDENCNEKEKRSKQELEIAITDDRIEIDAFKQMLIFIYSGFNAVELTEESVYAILYIAKKYLIKSLEKRCVTFFIMNLNAENVFSLIQHCIDFEADRILMEKCKEFLLFHTEEVLNSKAFTNISLKCLKALLEENFLDIAEVDLFKAVLRWTNFACESSKLPKTQENLRNMLSTAVLGLVRFPTISTKDFAYVVVPSKILTLQEERDILLTKRLADYQPENPLPYSKISRELEWAGTLRMRIDQFSSFAEVENNTQFSEQIFIGGFFWQIMAIGKVFPTKLSLGFYVKCQGKEFDPNWSCKASAKLIMKSPVKVVQFGEHFSRTITHNFCKLEDDWGFPQFRTLEQILSPDNGLIDSQGSVMLVAEVTVHHPPE